MASFRQQASDQGIWAAVRARAIGRLGKPLLLAYAVLLVVSVSAVLSCVFWMSFGVK